MSRALKRKLARALRAAEAKTDGLKPGSVLVAHAYHDDDCPAITSQALGDCTCNPDFEIEDLTEDQP